MVPRITLSVQRLLQSNRQLREDQKRYQRWWSPLKKQREGDNCAPFSSTYPFFCKFKDFYDMTVDLPYTLLWKSMRQIEWQCRTEGGNEKKGAILCIYFLCFIHGKHEAHKKSKRKKTYASFSFLGPQTFYGMTVYLPYSIHWKSMRQIECQSKRESGGGKEGSTVIHPSVVLHFGKHDAYRKKIKKEEK